MPKKFLLIRFGSMGDIIHALPAAATLRDSFPDAHIDWILDPRWQPLLEGNPTLTNIITLDRTKMSDIRATIRQLRAERYSCAIDFQSLYKSSLIAYFSGAPERLGFPFDYCREGPAAWFYTRRIEPRGKHKVEHNLSLAQAAGAQSADVRFPLAINAADDKIAAEELARHNVKEFFVLNPGGGWRSKCWPPARYGDLHRKLTAKYGWPGVVTIGPGEEELAAQLVNAAGDPPPAVILVGLGPLMALLKRAKFVVAADTGPMHLASALDVPTIGLFGPTDPARNGPFSKKDVVVHNTGVSPITYKRGDSYSLSMLAITTEQVVAAVEARLAKLS